MYAAAALSLAAKLEGFDKPLAKIAGFTLDPFDDSCMKFEDHQEDIRVAVTKIRECEKCILTVRNFG